MTVSEQLASMSEHIPKPITPSAHAVLDYSVATTFFAVGIRLARRHRRAATLAFLNGALVLGFSVITDYPGGIWRVISFKAHGTADVVQAALTGMGPVLFGFANDPEATYFYGQAASELGVIAATDWQAGSRTSQSTAEPRRHRERGSDESD